MTAHLTGFIAATWRFKYINWLGVKIDSKYTLNCLKKNNGKIIMKCITTIEKMLINWKVQLLTDILHKYIDIDLFRYI